MFAPVNGPPAAPPRVGLLTAATEGDASVPWDTGVVSWPESTGGWRIAQDCTTAVDKHGIDDPEQLPVGTRGIVLQTVVRARRTTVEEMSGRARRRLAAITSKALARELWTGTATQLAPYDLPGSGEYANPQVGDQYVNPYLTDPRGEMYTAALPPLAAVGEVEARLADVLAGGPGHIHVPVAILGELALALDRRGDVLYTAAGNIVIPDGGYPNRDQAGTGRHIYGTDQVTWWTGPITVLDDPSQVVRYDDNSIAVWAERPAAVLFNPQTLVGCPVEVP